MKHSKHRYGDQYFCSRCKCSWDINEEEPTICTISENPKPQITYPKPIDWENLKKALETNDWSKFPNIR